MGGSGLLLGWRGLVVWVGMLFVCWDVCVGGTGVFVVVVTGGSSMYVFVQVVAIVVAASVRPLAWVKSLVMLVVVQMSAHSLCAAWRPRRMNPRLQCLAVLIRCMLFNMGCIGLPSRMAAAGSIPCMTRCPGGTCCGGRGCRSRRMVVLRALMASRSVT